MELTTLFEREGNHERGVYEAEVKVVIDKYKKVFELPRCLLAARNREHAITLQEGTTPINYRPYRYSFLQKNEIERLLHEMLETRVIQPSISPYFSPMMLVKKKDGGWRFCVDYRVLNKVTIPDRYPVASYRRVTGCIKGSKGILKAGFIRGCCMRFTREE